MFAVLFCINWELCADGWFLIIRDFGVEVAEVLPAVVRGCGAVLACGLCCGCRRCGSCRVRDGLRAFGESARDGHVLLDFVVQEFHENRFWLVRFVITCRIAFVGVRFVEYDLHIRGHGDDLEIAPLFVKIAEFAHFCIGEVELHEGGQRQESAVVAKAECCRNGLS